MSLPPLDELQWKSPEWIQSFGLHTENVLDYFAQSPFFDRTSNNQVVKMQQQFSQQGTPQANLPLNNTGATPGDRAQIWERYPSHAIFEKELMKLKGIEYILVLVREPDLWVIRKQRREDSNTVVPLKYYYVIGSSVYQSPTLFKTMQSRLLSTNYHLSNALTQLNRLVEFQPSQGASFLRFPSTSHATTIATAGSSVPETGPANPETTGAATSAATALEPEGWKDTINVEVTDKLMTTSIKSKPVYI